MSASPSFDDAFAPAVRPDVQTVTIDGERVVFDPQRGEVHQLNPIGSVIWEFLDGTATIGELVADLSDAFHVAPDTVHADLVTLLAQLDEHSLLVDEADEDDDDVDDATGAQRGADHEPPSPTYLVDPPAP